MNNSNRILVTGAKGFVGSYLLKTWLDKEMNVIGTSREDTDLSKDMLTCRAVDTIVHTAALCPNKRHKVEQYVDNNVTATRNLCEYAQDFGIDKFIYLSTMSVYDSEPYGVTKLMGELILGDYDFESVIVRLPRVYADGTVTLRSPLTFSPLVLSQRVYEPTRNEGIGFGYMYLREVEQFLWSLL